MGKRVDLSDLADESPLAEARVPALAVASTRSARVEQVAPNPRNRRDVEAQPEKIEKLAESIRVHGQLQPSTVVSREAFLTIFPEDRDSIGSATFVQVTGARRRAAILKAGLPTIDITVKNGVAETRAKFLSATAAENIDREEYDPIEEARAVQDIVEECGTGQRAAEQLNRSPGWITQRTNLLKLVPELQVAVRASEIPLREVRDLHKRGPEEQLTALSEWRAVAKARQATDEKRQRGHEDSDHEDAPGSAGERPARARRSPVAAAVHRLGGTPVKIAESLRSELSPDDRRTLATELMRD